jgi:hypothetical protein
MAIALVVVSALPLAFTLGRRAGEEKLSARLAALSRRVRAYRKHAEQSARLLEGSKHER